MKLTFSSIVITSIILSLVISLSFTSFYLVISTNSCEKPILNEKLNGIILDSKTLKFSSKNEFLDFLKNFKEGQSFFLLTESGIYQCKYSNSSIFEVNEIKTSLLNIPLNFLRYETKDENIERLKLSKIDYIKEDAAYFKEPLPKLKESKEVKFYILINIPIENETIKIDEKEYSLEEIKEWKNISLINNTAILKFYLFNQSCIESFEYSYTKRIYSIVHLDLQIKDECKNILENILNKSGIKIIYNEKYFEYPIEMDIENKTLFQFYIPFTLSLQNKISTVMIFESQIDLKNLEIIKFYMTNPIKFEERTEFKIFIIDIVSIVIFSIFLIFSILKRKFEPPFLLAFVAFVFKPFLLIFSTLTIAYFLIKRKTLNIYIFFLAFIGILSIFYNHVYTAFLPLLALPLTITNKNYISIILLVISLPLFFFFEWLSFLFLVSSFLIFLRKIQ